MRAEYQRFSRPWSSCREELACFMGTMVLIESDWARGWMPEVYSADASLSGYGIATACWEGHDVASVGRVHEMSRWRLGASGARRHALELAGLSWAGKVTPAETPLASRSSWTVRCGLS